MTFNFDRYYGCGVWGRGGAPAPARKLLGVMATSCSLVSSFIFLHLPIFFSLFVSLPVPPTKPAHRGSVHNIFFFIFSFVYFYFIFIYSPLSPSLLLLLLPTYSSSKEKTYTLLKTPMAFVLRYLKEQRVINGRPRRILCPPLALLADKTSRMNINPELWGTGPGRI